MTTAPRMVWFNTQQSDGALAGTEGPGSGGIRHRQNVHLLRLGPGQCLEDQPYVAFPRLVRRRTEHQSFVER